MDNCTQFTWGQQSCPHQGLTKEFQVDGNKLVIADDGHRVYYLLHYAGQHYGRWMKKSKTATLESLIPYYQQVASVSLRLLANK